VGNTEAQSGRIANFKWTFEIPYHETNNTRSLRCVCVYVFVCVLSCAILLPSSLSSSLSLHRFVVHDTEPILRENMYGEIVPEKNSRNLTVSSCSFSICVCVCVCTSVCACVYVCVCVCVSVNLTMRIIYALSPVLPPGPYRTF
jgi:hypothetical protein